MNNEIPDYVKLLSLAGRGVIVLGAGQGIGEQTAHALSQAGAKVLCVDLDARRAEKVAQNTGGIAYVADVLSRPAMQALFASAPAMLGVAVVGIVDVVGMPISKPLAEMDDESWQRQFDLVLRHAYLAIQLGAPVLTQGGSIVLVGSVAGSWARAGTLLGYSVAKAGLHQLARSAAKELGPNQIRVNVVAPGLTRTPRLVEANDQSFWEDQDSHNPLGRVGTPADIAGAILYLCTPLAAYVTGNVLMLDGGMSLGPSLAIAKSSRAQ
jgi:NAD(P)-dependent dehydrogenase (short-subunit alcohol dehydrogenase family)